MSGIAGYPRTRGDFVPPEVIDALVAAGRLTRDEASAYSTARQALLRAGRSALRSIMRFVLRDKNNDTAYLDRVNHHLIAGQAERDRNHSPSSVVLYHHTGARELPGFRYQEVRYEKKLDRAQYSAERNAFDRSERKAWLQGIATSRRAELLAAGLPADQVDRMAIKGWVPIGYHVHHRIPLDDGGTNGADNLVLIRDDIEHRALHGYYNPSELRTRLLQPGERATIALAIPPADTVVYPNPAKGYEAKHVPYSHLLRSYNVD